MSSHSRQSRPRYGGYTVSTPSPLRHASNASTDSSAYSGYSNPFPPSRTSTVSSHASNDQQYPGAGHKRGYSESTIGQSNFGSSDPGGKGVSPDQTYKSMRQSLRPLPQAPASSSPRATENDFHAYSQQERTQGLQETAPLHDEVLRSPSHSEHRHTRSENSPIGDPMGSPPGKSATHKMANSMAISRSDSVLAPTHKRPGLSRDQSSPPAQPGHLLETPDLKSMQKSTTRHLRTLSKFAENGDEEDFTIKSPEQEVAGLHGRRRLQRTMSSRGKKTSTTTGWGGAKWMDQQRQFLQAYEYLCHIGEAKEWIEDIIKQPIPPIVELEEALRNGVTLAEVVQALYPDKQFRIFRNPRLQFRHSDNIALFFRFLADVELPELFRFELVDLYEKKNIPKVIYCIHALSWLLFRKGIVDFRIGNLVGQLQFEDHELEAMQKGLDKAGISMPNFGGMREAMGAEPEPEPVEREEERIDRELLENEHVVVDLQAQIRAGILRAQLGDLMNDLWDSEEWLVDLQTRIRGGWARQVVQYKMDMRRFAVELQSLIRGSLVRSRCQKKEQSWKDSQKEIVTLQSLVRARKARHEVQHVKSRMQRNDHGIRNLQAAIRGALSRWDVGDQYCDITQHEASVVDLQAAIRGALSRKVAEDQYSETREAEPKIQLLQSAIRGALCRISIGEDLYDIQQHEQAICELQAAARGAIARDRVSYTLGSLDENMHQLISLQSRARAMHQRKITEQLHQQLNHQTGQIVNFQAEARGAQLRARVLNIRAALAKCEDQVLRLQSTIRGYLVRRQYHSDLEELRTHEKSVVELQAASRASLLRQNVFETLSRIGENESEIVSLQSLSRAMLLRSRIGDLFVQLEAEEDSIVDLQTFARGKLVRRRFAEKQKHYKENMEKVVKIQSFVRGRQQGEAYKSLTGGKNPPVGTVKNFVHLLNDSDFDFDEELEFERLRKTVVQHVRQNEMAEQYIDQLDIKIALLVKNKITLDEVVKHQRHFGGHVGSLLTNKEISSKDPFDLKALNKNSRKKLEHYQQFFFILQTQPQYLARLFKKVREQGTAEKESKRLESLMMVLFGFAQKRREEYYLLKLISRSIKEEVDGCSSLQDYLRSNFFWSKILNSYIRSPRDRKYMRDLLGPMIKENIIDNQGLDLESDPLQIYRSAINNEELRTGQRSYRQLDVPREVAIKDPETRQTFIEHMQDLRDIADQFFAALEDTMHRLPYGIRFVAQQTFELLRQKFPYENQQHLLQIVGQWIWKTYLLPPLTQPENWGVVDRGLSPLHKRNLGEVAKVLGQIAAARLFGGENVYLQPLNSYITEAVGRSEDIWATLLDVRDAEAQFDIDEFNDHYSRTKPTLYIKMTDIFAIHQLIASDISYVAPIQDDALRDVIRELGSVKSNEHEMMGVSGSEISLQLIAKLHNVEDPDAAIKNLFMETKRCVLYIIRIQSGANLMEIMVRPISDEEEQRWEDLVRSELLNPSNKRHNPYTSDPNNPLEPSTHTLIDITTLTYAELKRTALENILTLELHGRLTRHNHYQDLLNAIALDIRTKHRRRVQRARELDGVRATLSQLDQKAAYLDSQLKSYNNYIEQAMNTLQSKNANARGGRRRFLLPFTRQYNHERELERSGRKPKFGSFKYSARQLAEKGVLVEWKGFPESEWGRCNLTISSDEVGVFHIEGSSGSMMIPGASASVPLDELLQAQFDNHQFMNLFEGGGGGPGQGALRLNVNLFLHLVFKKFYRDE
ncbi:MAG: hypothetical protein Q9165_003281 [Trypethelium subeluteriae]